MDKVSSSRTHGVCRTMKMVVRVHPGPCFFGGCCYSSKSNEQLAWLVGCNQEFFALQPCHCSLAVWAVLKHGLAGAIQVLAPANLLQHCAVKSAKI